MAKIRNLFYFSYIGGKSKELKYVMPLVDMTKYHTIVEPFCGSCIFSTTLYDKHPSLRYHVNDIDNNLYDFLQDVKHNGSSRYFDYCRENWQFGVTTKEKYNVARAETGLNGWFYRNKIFNIRKGLYPTTGRNFCLEHDKYQHLDTFFMNNNVTVTNNDFLDVLEQYKNDSNALLFLDPPYFLTDNNHYSRKGESFGGAEMHKDEYVDPTKALVSIKDALNNSKCNIIMIINDCGLLRDYYSEYYVTSYNKTYQFTKNKSKHMIITNITPQNIDRP